jgi:hypothetical protein
LRSLWGLEVHHRDALLLRARLLFGAEREEQDQQQPFDRERQANGERPASGACAEPFEEGRGWNGAGLKQWVCAGGIDGRGARKVPAGIVARPTFHKLQHRAFTRWRAARMRGNGANFDFVSRPSSLSGKI